MPLSLDDILGSAYLAPADFAARAAVFGAGTSISGLDEPALKALGAAASRAIDAFCGRDFNPDAVTETHRFDERTRRVSVNRPPVMTLQSYKFVIAPGRYSDVSVAEVFVNNQENYLELVSVTQIPVLTTELLTFGMGEPQVEVTYLSYAAIPGAVAAACGFTMAKMANMGYVSALLPDGLQKVKIGPLEPSRVVSGANDALDLPVIAKQLLTPFKRIALG